MSPRRRDNQVEAKAGAELVKEQQSLLLTRTGEQLVIFVVWTMFPFHLCADMIMEWLHHITEWASLPSLCCDTEL